MSRTLIPLAFCLLFAACSDSEPQNASAPVAAPPAAPVRALCEIDANSIAGIPLGITPEQIRQSFPKAIITPVRDAEGVEFLSVKLNPEVEVFVYGEEGGEVPAGQRPATYLDTASKACKTAQGVHPDMTIQAAAHIYGAVQQVLLSETEARQSVEFAGQPATLSFRIDDSGAFDDTAEPPQIATEYREDAKIQSIAVFALPEGGE